jgi:hypothetical protein
MNEETIHVSTEPQVEAMLLFTDAAGAAYLLPAALLEQVRLSAEQLVALRAQFADDVHGNVQDMSERTARCT